VYEDVQPQSQKSSKLQQRAIGFVAKILAIGELVEKRQALMMFKKKSRPMKLIPK
jgi:hypothetical protein